MKKIITSLLMLAAMFVSTSAWAAEYGVSVCGTKVTDSNKNNVTGSGISGTVTYDSSNQILILKNATLTPSSGYDGIYNQNIDGLSIQVEGTLTINVNSSANNCAGIYCNAFTKIGANASASPTININQTGVSYAIKSYGGANIRLFRVTLNATASNNHAIFADSGANLTVYGSTSELKFEPPLYISK